MASVLSCWKRSKENSTKRRGIARARCSSFTPSALRIEERGQVRAEPILQVALLLQSTFEQRLDSLLSFRPGQGGRKSVAALEEPIDRWERDMVDQLLRGRDRAAVERGDAAAEFVRRMHPAHG